MNNKPYLTSQRSDRDLYLTEVWICEACCDPVPHMLSFVRLISLQ